MRNKRRIIEWGKNILIVLLTLSALFLLTMTPLVQDSGLAAWLRPGRAYGNASPVSVQPGLVLPARLAVYRDGERYGLQYDDERMEELFAAFGPLLGEALSGAGEPVPLTGSGWRDRLGRPGACFDFSGTVPLSALSRWLGGEECALKGSARRAVLCAAEDDQVALCWQDAGDGGFYACATTLSRSLHLDPALETVSPNGAYFAFEDDRMASLLDPFTLITETGGTGTQYAVTSPLTAAAGMEALLDALSFNSQNHAPGSSGEVYLDGADRLVVRDGSTVTYRAAQGDKYPVESRNGVTTAGQAADGARALAERALGPLYGDARLYLLSAEEYGEGWRVRFGYRLDGCTVYLNDEGWAAEFIVQGGYITDFVLRVRGYTADGGSVLLLPIDKAAVLLPDLSKEKRELVIRYRDGGGQTVTPHWEAI